MLLQAENVSEAEGALVEALESQLNPIPGGAAPKFHRLSPPSECAVGKRTTRRDPGREWRAAGIVPAGALASSFQAGWTAPPPSGISFANSVDDSLSRLTALELQGRVHAALATDHPPGAHQVRVEFAQGVVVLRGHVRSWEEREVAQAAAQVTPEVADVRNELIVQPWPFALHT